MAADTWVHASVAEAASPARDRRDRCTGARRLRDRADRGRGVRRRPRRRAGGQNGIRLPSQACGAQSAATVASVDEQVGKRIYEDELSGRETLEDEAHVRQSKALLSALSASDNAAVSAAVSAIVYTPHWHIVRLRVLRAGHVIARRRRPLRDRAGDRHHPRARSHAGELRDVGAGRHRLREARHQADRGPGRALPWPFAADGHRDAVPPVPRTEGHVEVRGGVYRARVFTTGSFPDGTLTVALLIPLPPPSLSSVSCGQVRADSWGSVAMHVQARLALHSSSWDELVRVVAGHQRSGGVRPLRRARARRRHAAASPSHRRERADRRTDPVGVLVARGPAGEGLRGRPDRGA